MTMKSPEPASELPAGFTGTQDLYALLKDALEQQIAEWGLVLRLGQSERGPYLVGYGSKSLGDELGWGVRLVVSAAEYGDGVWFTASPLAHYAADTGWEWLQHLHAAEGEPGLSVTQSWGKVKYPELYNTFHLPGDYPDRIERTVLRYADYLKHQAAAKVLADSYKARFGADRQGRFQQPGVAGTVSYGETHVSMTLKITTDDPDKVSAILALMAS